MFIKKAQKINLNNEIQNLQRPSLVVFFLQFIKASFFLSKMYSFKKVRLPKAKVLKALYLNTSFLFL